MSKRGTRPAKKRGRGCVKVKAATRPTGPFVGTDPPQKAAVVARIIVLLDQMKAEFAKLGRAA